MSMTQERMHEIIERATKEIDADMKVISTLKALVRDLSDALTDEGPDWSQAGLDNLRCRVAAALPGTQCPDWLHEYRCPELRAV